MRQAGRRIASVKHWHRKSSEARRQQQQNCKSDRDQEARAHSSIDHHAGHSASPIAAKAYKQPGADPLAGYTRQHLSEEHTDSRDSNRGDNSHPRVTHREGIENIALAHSQKRDLKYDHQHRERHPAKVQQGYGGPDSLEIDLPGDVPKTPPGHDQLRGKDRNFSGAVTARHSARVKIACHAGAHPTLASDPSIPARAAGPRPLRRALSAMVMAERNGKFKRRIGEASRRPGPAPRCRRRKARPQQGERFAEIGDHLMRGCSLLPLAGMRCEQDPQAEPGRRAGFDVAHLIAHDHATSGIELEVRHGLQDHSRFGLAPRMIATVLADALQRVIRAVVDAGDRCALRFKAIAHPSRQVRTRLFIEIATADAGLVGDDDDWPPQLGPVPATNSNWSDRWT
jgi:hypothetical protein